MASKEDCCALCRKHTKVTPRKGDDGKDGEVIVAQPTKSDEEADAADRLLPLRGAAPNAAAGALAAVKSVAGSAPREAAKAAE